MATTDDVWAQGRQLSQRRERRIPIDCKCRRRTGQFLIRGEQTAPGIHVHTYQGIAREKDAIRITKKTNVTGRMSGSDQPVPAARAGNLLLMEFVNAISKISFKPRQKTRKECSRATDSRIGRRIKRLAC